MNTNTYSSPTSTNHPPSVTSPQSNLFKMITELVHTFQAFQYASPLSLQPCCMYGNTVAVLDFQAHESLKWEGVSGTPCVARACTYER